MIETRAFVFVVVVVETTAFVFVVVVVETTAFVFVVVVVETRAFMFVVVVVETRAFVFVVSAARTFVFYISSTFIPFFTEFIFFDKFLNRFGTWSFRTIFRVAFFITPSHPISSFIMI
ncbi:hypothetical protein [Peribacillus sp. SCS-37]|uniref:hypothetical protein n=1 Tax=Paraperibacillus esterisolvens TaxID=3115296 RepID=UPI00390605E9